MTKLEMKQPRDLGRIGAEKEQSAVECATFLMSVDSIAGAVQEQRRNRTRRTPRTFTQARTRSREKTEALFARLTNAGAEVIYKRHRRVVRECV